MTCSWLFKSRCLPLFTRPHFVLIKQLALSADHSFQVVLVRRWLIAIAYWLSGGFIKSGLGNRIAYAIVAAFGKTTLGLTYSLVFAEALLAPAIPSVSHVASSKST